MRAPRQSHQVVQSTPGPAPAGGALVWGWIAVLVWGGVLPPACPPGGAARGLLSVICGWHDLWMIAMHGGVFRADRAIRTGQLRALPRVHTRPIDVMVYHGPLGVAPWETWFRGGFPA